MSAGFKESRVYKSWGLDDVNFYHPWRRQGIGNARSKDR